MLIVDNKKNIKTKSKKTAIYKKDLIKNFN